MKQRQAIPGRAAVLLAGLVIALLGAGPARAATPIDRCPFRISAPGNYVVTQDLVCEGFAPAILIEVSDVHLNLNGHRLTGNRSGIGILVRAAAPLSNVHIHGGDVTNFSTGVYLSAVNRSHVNGVVATDNAFDGIRLDFSHDNHVNGSTFSRNGAVGARLFFLSSGNRFNGNTVTENVAGGYSLETGSTGNVITGDDISSNGAVGVLIDVDSHGNTVRNSAVNNTRAGGRPMPGIQVRSHNNLIRGNRTDGNLIGILLVASVTGNTVQGNTANGNVLDGIGAGLGAAGNTFIGNTALGNGALDLNDRNIPFTGCVNTWTGNTFVTDNEMGADSGPGAGCVR